MSGSLKKEILSPLQNVSHIFPQENLQGIQCLTNFFVTVSTEYFRVAVLGAIWDVFLVHTEAERR